MIATPTGWGIGWPAKRLSDAAPARSSCAIPELYLPLPGAVVAAAAPWAALGLLAAVRSHRRTLLRLGVVGYVVALVVERRGAPALEVSTPPGSLLAWRACMSCRLEPCSAA